MQPPVPPTLDHRVAELERLVLAQQNILNSVMETLMLYGGTFHNIIDNMRLIATAVGGSIVSPDEAETPSPPATVPQVPRASTGQTLGGYL